MPKAKRPKWAEKDAFCVTKITKDYLLSVVTLASIKHVRIPPLGRPQQEAPTKAQPGTTFSTPSQKSLHSCWDKSCPLLDVQLINAWRPMHRLRSVLKSIPNHFRYQNMPYSKAEKIAISAQIFNIHSQKKLHPCKLKSHTEAMN